MASEGSKEDRVFVAWLHGAARGRPVAAILADEHDCATYRVQYICMVRSLADNGLAIVPTELSDAALEAVGCIHGFNHDTDRGADDCHREWWATVVDVVQVRG